MGKRVITQHQYKGKKFINFGYEDSDEAKAKFRSFRLSEQQVKCVLNNKEKLDSLMGR